MDAAVQKRLLGLVRKGGLQQMQWIGSRIRLSPTLCRRVALSPFYEFAFAWLYASRSAANCSAKLTLQSGVGVRRLRMCPEKVSKYDGTEILSNAGSTDVKGMRAGGSSEGLAASDR